MIKLNMEQKSEAWHNARLHRVTGTSFKDLMATKTTAGYNNLIADIAAEIVCDVADDGENYENEWMLRGTELEPLARQMYENLFGCTIEQVGFVIPDKENKYHKWVGVSPDGLTSDNGMIEIKCPKRSTHWYYLINGKLPSEYRYQVQGQLFVTGLDYCDFISFHPDLKPFIIRVEPDLELFKKFEIELDLLIETVCACVKRYNEFKVIDLTL